MKTLTISRALKLRVIKHAGAKQYTLLIKNTEIFTFNRPLSEDDEFILFMIIQAFKGLYDDPTYDISIVTSTRISAVRLLTHLGNNCHRYIEINYKNSYGTEITTMLNVNINKGGVVTFMLP